MVMNKRSLFFGPESKTPGELPPETRAADWQGSDSLSAQDLQLPSVRREQNTVRKTEWEIRPCTGTMRTLVILTLLAVLVVAATSYESHESMESHEYLNPFLNRRRANDFIQADTRLRAITQERIRERSKAPQEHQRELCEDYYPCEMYAFRHGYAAAYKHYFGGRRRTK